MTSAPVNAKVRFADDTQGEVQSVVVHRLSHIVTHVVVRGPARRMRPDGQEHIARLVPIDQVAHVDHGTVLLKCTMPEFLELEPFLEEKVKLMSYPDYQHAPIDPTGMPLGPTMNESYYFTESTERIPEDEIGVQVGTKIESQDGEEVGHLAELVVTPDTGEVTHFVLEHNERHTSLPLTLIDHARQDTIYLKLDKKAIEQLPSVPARPKGGWEGSDIDMVGLIFDSQAQADEVMAFIRDLHGRGTIRVRNAALLAKSPDGKITVKERHDLDAKNGAVGGAVLGGVLGLLTGGIGLVAAPVIGAGLGAVTGRVVDRGFDDTFLKSLAERLQPGRSGLLLIVQSEWRVPLQESLKGRGNIILQQELTDRLIAELTAESAEVTAESPSTA